MITGITRVRNEALILEDTLRHFLKVCDRILLYDDCSTDRTVEIARSFRQVQVVSGAYWEGGLYPETRQRAILLGMVKSEWVLCFDADERLEGNLPDLTADGYRFRLFDGYLARGFMDPYLGGDLSQLQRLWGPEYRDILMLFRRSGAGFSGPGQRAPTMKGRIEQADVLVQHFGKCLSIDQWEANVDHYSKFPEPYGSKWAARRGKAIHEVSDFGRPLHPWFEVSAHGVKL